MRHDSPIARVLFSTAALVGLLASGRPAGAGEPGGEPGFPAPAPAAPVERRHASGLVVQEAAARPDPVALPESVAQRLHDAYELGMRNRNDFSYPWVDEATGEVVIDVTGAAGTEKAAALKSAKASGPPAHRLRQVKHSWARFDGIRDDIVEQTTSRLLPDEDAIFEIEPDGRHNRLIVVVDRLSEPLLAALAARYGTDVIAVRLDAKKERAAPQARENDTSSGGFYGGANVNGCTSGFSWYWGTTYAMLTAGHCFPSGGSASTPAEFMGSVTSGSRENWTSGVGTVFLTGQTTNRGDLALIQLASPKQSAARIYRGDVNSSSSAPVREMWNRQAANGDQYCTGGRVSGEECGWVVTRVRFDLRYTVTNEWVRNINEGRKQAECTKGGDSGGPVYTVRPDGGIAAKGIHSGGGGGGSDQWGGAFDPCWEYFTDVWQAYWGLPGVLRVQ